MIALDIVQITADNSNVYNGRYGETPPPWARRLRFMLVFSDQDVLYSFSAGGQELCRDSGPSASQADNLNSPEWTLPHLSFEFPRGSVPDILANINVVTGGTGLAILQFES